MNRTILILFLALVFSACSWMHGDDIRPEDNLVNVGDTLPAFALSMSDGSCLSTSDLRGKPSLILFFSTDCPDCTEVLPALNRRYLAHGGDTSFVAIGREQPYEVVADYWSQQGLSLPFSAQSDRAVYSLFARRGIPRIYISDPSLVVRIIVDGRSPGL